MTADRKPVYSGNCPHCGTYNETSDTIEVKVLARSLLKTFTVCRCGQIVPLSERGRIDESCRLTDLS